MKISFWKYFHCDQGETFIVLDVDKMHVNKEGHWNDVWAKSKSFEYFTLEDNKPSFLPAEETKYCFWEFHQIFWVLVFPEDD